MAHKIAPKRIVIDTNIARSASTTSFPTSVACRGILDHTREALHSVVLSPTQKKEWIKHKSAYATKWLANMFSRRQCYLLKEDPVGEVTELLYAIDCDKNVRAVIMKDVHLLESAIITDRVVISMDNKMYDHFSRLSRELNIKDDIAWVDPLDNVDDCIEWIRKGVPVEEARCILINIE